MPWLCGIRNIMKTTKLFSVSITTLFSRLKYTGKLAFKTPPLDPQISKKSNN